MNADSPYSRSGFEGEKSLPVAVFAAEIGVYHGFGQIVRYVLAAAYFNSLVNGHRGRHKIISAGNVDRSAAFPQRVDCRLQSLAYVGSDRRRIEKVYKSVAFRILIHGLVIID